MITLTSTNGGMVEFSHGTVINNGTINVEGDGDGSIATGVVFNSDTLGGTGWVNVNSGYLMASGDNPNFAFTNNSNICLNGGKMSVGNLGTNVGVFKFNLTQYAGKAAEQAGGADTAGKEIVTVRVGGTADFTGKTDANLILTGGTKDKYYGLFSAATGYDGIATSYASKYLFGTENGNLWVQYLGADANAIVEAADAASSSNDSIAHFIVDNYDNLPAELRDKLDEITDAGKLGRALTELNGTNSQTAQAQASLNASHQFNAALGQVFGDTFAANLVRGNTNNAQFGGRSSAGGKPTGATGAGAGYVTGFVKAYGGFGSQGSTHAAAGYDFGGVGVLVGSGYKFANELELGALFGYSWNKAESYGNYGENTDNILRLGLYGNYAYDNLFFNTAPTFGIHLINTERNTILGTAKSDRTGFDFSWFNRLGYTFELPADFYLTPSYALSMTYFRDPSHSEYGTGSVSSRFGDYDQWSLVQNLELRVGKLFRVSDCFALLPEIWGGWEHEYINNNNTVAQSFTTVQGNWVAPVKAIAQDRAVLGVGLTTIIKNKYEVYGRYDERLWDGGHASQFTLGLSVKF
ncbi:hypothetical protein AGMMS49959_18450 [Planctomycetales bacterium]|nr:hypothetical protein AGMMS49959_18450 [Planctomycetales bacterium]